MKKGRQVLQIFFGVVNLLLNAHAAVEFHGEICSDFD